MNASPTTKLYSLSFLVLSRLDANDTKGLIIGRGSLEGVKRETIKKRLALITRNIDNLKLKIGSSSPSDASDQEANYLRTISNLERNANVLKKLLSIDSWFYLDPDPETHHQKGINPWGMDELNTSLLGGWPLDESILQQLTSKFDVVTMDPAVYEKIFQDNSLLKKSNIEDNELSSFKLSQIRSDISRGCEKLLKNIHLITKSKGLFIFTDNLYVGLAEYKRSNVEGVRNRIIPSLGWNMYTSGNILTNKDWILPHNHFSKDLGQKFSGDFTWYACEKE